MVLPNTVGYMLAGFEHPENQTVKSIVKQIIPEVSMLSGEDYTSALNKIPMSRLEQAIDSASGGWSEAVAASLKTRGFNSNTYLKTYAGAIRRFIERTAEIAVPAKGLTQRFECWDQLSDLVNLVYPGKREVIDGLLDRGISVFGGIDLSGKPRHQVYKALQNARSSFNTLKRECMQRGLSVKDFESSILKLGNYDAIPCLIGKTNNFYDCKHLWNWLREIEPSLGMGTWSDCKPVVALPIEACPDNLLEGLEQALFDNHELKSGSDGNYRGAMMAYFGILEGEGYSLWRLTKLQTPRDSLRLVTLGFPRELLTHDPVQDNPYILARRLIEDAEFRDCVLKQMRTMDGSISGQGCIENPFVRVGINARYRNKAYPSARQLIMRVSYINKHYFHIQAHHYQWIAAITQDVAKKEKAKSTAYNEKKHEAFRRPTLWIALRDRFLEIEASLLADVANPTHEWAVQVARTALFHLLLLYPLRKANLGLIRLDKEFNRETFEIQIQSGDVKNGRYIDLSIPRTGLGRGLFEILTVYLNVARPLILAGKDSDYLFVPEQTRPNSGLKLRKAALNTWLKVYIKQHLADVLPPVLIQLNPHIFRHITASWAIVVKKSVVLAAQLLGDTVETVLKSYSDVLASSKEQLLEYYEASDTAPVNIANLLN